MSYAQPCDNTQKLHKLCGKIQSKKNPKLLDIFWISSICDILNSTYQFFLYMTISKSLVMILAITFISLGAGSIAWGLYSRHDIVCTQRYAIDYEKIRREEYARAASAFRDLIPTPTVTPEATATPTLRIIRSTWTPTPKPSI